MKPRSIGIVAGGGGPIGSSAVLCDIISECQKQFGSWRSYEYPCINFYSFPYSEMLIVHNNASSIPSRELSYCIQQLKLLGMEIIVVPCFTMSSFLTYRSYGVELIEMGPLMKGYLETKGIENPLVLCSGRTRNSHYCDNHFPCHYPSEGIQGELGILIEMALKGEKIDLQPLLNKLPDVPIVSAVTVLNAQLKSEVQDPRWIDTRKILASFVVQQSYKELSSPKEEPTLMSL